jgi:flavin reductase (DIM6/NTAB) family NADH-FMN oxidoreductase RutF
VTVAHAHGDHVVFIGEVLEVRVSDATPLLYYAGAYGDFA